MDIVWTNGCFDLLHFGHIEMLKFAKSKGDILYVGIDSDARISQSKGVNRPIQDWRTRVAVMESLRYVDRVFLFDTDYQLERLIERFNPKMIVIGEEYKGKRIIGVDFCENITFLPRIIEYSTTKLITKI
jgi:D-beta-D-heptose 7-phosphate kinase/D-beta-D-heptose 1-phosphate adenosyltransferase